MLKKFQVDKYLAFCPQFLGLVLQSGQKLTLGLLAAISLERVPFCACPLFPALQPFSKCILEVVFHEGVQHCP
jgi:hypothetical protein